MDAVIFAAGLGTRLKPLTDSMPKALVEVGGVPMLERVARRLIAAGVDRLVVNAHAFADQIETFLRDRDGFGIEVHVSVERTAPLETGGGLYAARQYLRRDAPFFVHNADVFTDLPLGKMYESHLRSEALATLAVRKRDTTRALLFDDLGLLGRVDDTKGLRLEAREPRGQVTRLPFSGVHVVSPALLDHLLVDRASEGPAFSILMPYLRLAAAGEHIAPYRVDTGTWVDIGRPEQLEEARRLAFDGSAS